MNEFKRKMLKPLDFVFNRKLKRYALGPNCIEIIGMRGAGKSTVYSLVAEEAKKAGKKVYCQYPYKDCYQIPVIPKDLGYWESKKIQQVNGTWKEFKVWHPHIVMQVDKEWLYKTDFSNCVILLDEARTIYPARAFKDWSIADDEFFNFLRKAKVNVYLSSQEYAALDVNVHRAVDEVWFLYKNRPNSPFTRVEVYESMTVPIENLQKRVRLSRAKGEMYQLDWDICGQLTRKFCFYRPPYYDLFSTDFFYREFKPDDKSVLWSDEDLAQLG